MAVIFLTWPSPASKYAWLQRLLFRRGSGTPFKPNTTALMQLTDQQIKFFDSTVLKIGPEKIDEYIRQSDHLIDCLQAKIDAETSFGVKKLTKTGSLVKATALRLRDGYQVDIDIASPHDVSEACKSD